MTSASDLDGADDKTQLLDADSPSSDYRQDTVPLECTLPLDDGDGEETCLLGETQAMEVEEETECNGEERPGYWGETQVVDDGGDDEGTQVLSDGNDSSHSFRAEECQVGDGVDYCNNQSQMPSVADERLSAGPGTAKRSISDFRVASMRASCLSAARSWGKKSIDGKEQSHVGRWYDDKKGIVVGVQSAERLEKDIRLTDTGKEVFPEAGFGEVHPVYRNCILDMSPKNHHRNGMKHKIGNRTARKLFDDVIDTLEEKRSTDNNGSMQKEESSCIQAGLSYINSQEPGEFSQANALNVVDNILSLNDLGLTKDACVGTPIDTKLPGLSSLKGAQCLAKSCKIPIVKVGAFDWDDGLEDESGGDFFSRNRDLIFSNGKSGRQAAGIRCSEETKHKSLSSGIKIHNSYKNDKLLTFESTTMKNLFKEVNQLQAAGPVNQCLEEPGIGMDASCMEDIGPDTQLAAEAMKILVSGRSMEPEFQDMHAGERNINGFGQNTAMKAHSLGQLNPQKEIPSNPDSEGNLRRSKRLKLSSNRPKKLPRNSRTKTKIREGSASAEVTASVKNAAKKQKKLATENKSRILNFKNDNEVSDGRSLRQSRDNMLIKNVKSSTSIGATEAQTSITELSADGTHNKHEEFLPKQELRVDVIYTPIAHRTRQISTKTSKRVDTSSNASADKNCGQCYAYAAKDRGHKISDNGIHRESIQGQCDVSDDEYFMRDTCNNNQAIGEIPSCYPKRRRTCLRYSRNLHNVANPTLRSGISPSDLPQQNQLDDVDQSIVMTQGKGNRKKQTDTMGMTLETCEYLLNDRSGCVLSGVGLRLSASPLKKESLTKTKNSEISGITSSSSPSKMMNSLSPVCTTLDPLKIPNRNYSSRSSLAKELARLESTRVTSTPVMKDTRRRKDMTNVRVIFSRHLGNDIIKRQKKILARLRVPIASSILDATHFIADEFVRTRNMLEAMAAGKPVVTHLWLESCGQAGCYIDEKNYIMRDLKKEKEIGFSMPASLARASEHPLLLGKRVFITANVKPDRETVSCLVKASGGQPLERIVRSVIKDEKALHDLLIISCEEDYNICIPLLEKGSEVFSSELLLNGIVVQNLAYWRHPLFTDHVKRTRSTIWLRTQESDRFLPVAKCK